MAKKIFNFGERLALYEDLPANTQYNTMPEPNIENINNIIQYTGDTNQNYTNGYYYKCISDGQDPATYSWEQIDVQPSSNMDIYTYTTNNLIVMSTLKRGIYIPTITNLNTFRYALYSNSTVSDLGVRYTGELIVYNEISDIENPSQDILFAILRDYHVPSHGQKMNVLFYLTPQNTIKVTYDNFVYGDYSKIAYLTLEAQDIYGVKTFQRIPKQSNTTAPTNNAEFTNKKYVDDQDKIILNNIAPQYSASSTYNEGDHVIYNGVLYECNTTISVAEAWTPAHWTQKEILSYIDNKISSIDTTKREIVQTLPTQDVATDTIYMVPKTTPGTQNVYDEYMYINNAWELIGSTEVDLTNYYTKSEVDAMITNINNQIGNIAEVLSHLTNPVIPIGTVLYTEDVSRTVGNVTYEGTYTATVKEFHADTNYYVIDYTFENTGSDDIPGLVLDEITTNPAGHLPLMAAYTIEAGETVTLTSYWQDSATYAATEARYQVPGNVSVEFDTTDNTTNYTSDLALNKLDGFTTDVVAHVHAYDSNAVDEGWTHTTFSRTGGTEDPYTVPEPFTVAWINFEEQTFGTLSGPISDTLTMTRSYIGFNADQFDQNHVAFFLAKMSDIEDCTWEEFEAAYYDYTGGVN